MASYQKCKPTWEHIEDVAQAPTSPTLSREDKPMPPSPPVTISPSDEESQEDEVPQQFFVPAHLHRATSQRSPSQWLALADGNEHTLSSETRQLIETFASMQTNMDALSRLLPRPGRPQSGPSSSADVVVPSLTAASASASGLQQAAAETERSLRVLCGRLGGHVEEEIKQRVLQRVQRRRAADGERERRELARRQLKAREAVGDGKTEGTERCKSSMSAQEQRELTLERSAALAKGEWRKSW
ncbi:uncharacterized protein PG998_004415 [Apiospora kogelbergensis]|uniref:uncharacterized protein n=1 Tax=Apiospora kogelbergensis TaxID=1337665 RepID=UPI0031321B58